MEKNADAKQKTKDSRRKHANGCCKLGIRVRNTLFYYFMRCEPGRPPLQCSLLRASANHTDLQIGDACNICFLCLFVWHSMEHHVNAFAHGTMYDVALNKHGSCKCPQQCARLLRTLDIHPSSTTKDAWKRGALHSSADVSEQASNCVASRRGWRRPSFLQFSEQGRIQLAVARQAART